MSRPNLSEKEYAILLATRKNWSGEDFGFVTKPADFPNLPELLGYSTQGSLSGVIDLNIHQRISGGGYSFVSETTLKHVRFPLLRGVGTSLESDSPAFADVGINFDSCSVINHGSDFAPNLETVVGDFTIKNCALQTSGLRLPKLTYVGGNVTIQNNTNAGFVAIAFPRVPLTILGNITFSGNTHLLGFIKDSGASGNAWTDITLSDGATFDFSGCALTTNAVNGFIGKCEELGFTSATIILNGGTNGAPSGPFVASKAALILAGCTVTTN